ncbi:MAG: HAD family hydrolase [Candidatus Anammoxibacter sp.]
MNVKAIIFDSDDTILDFSSVACPVIQDTAQKLTLRIPEDDEINKLWGMPLKLFLKKLWNDVDVDKFKENYYFLIEKCHFNEIAGAKEAIRFLSGMYALGVLTTKPEYLMYDNFKDAGFDLDIFKFLHGAEHSIHRKPDPRVLDKSLEVLGLEPEQVLYVGDSMFDYEAAKNAGLHFVAVETGYYKEKDFIGNGLEKKNIIASVKHLPLWLKAIESN